jgi:hypothetical protein
MIFLLIVYDLGVADGTREGEERLLLPVVVLEAVAGVIPFAVSRQFVTTLCVRPSVDLFAVFIQLINGLNSFLVSMLELAVVVAEEGLPPPPRKLELPPLLLPVLLLTLVFFVLTANAV